MTIAKDTVVTLNYVLTNDKGEILEESGDSPLVYLHGHRNIVPGLEKALDGLEVGASTKTSVSPSEGYGEYDPELKFAMPKSRMGENVPPLDALVQLKNSSGQTFVARVVGSDEEKVTFDANHPLAGENLNFEVTVTEVRAAEADELAHGHVHSEGCHHH